MWISWEVLPLVSPIIRQLGPGITENVYFPLLYLMGAFTYKRYMDEWPQQHHACECTYSATVVNKNPLLLQESWTACFLNVIMNMAYTTCRNFYNISSVYSTLKNIWHFKRVFFSLWKLKWQWHLNFIYPYPSISNLYWKHFLCEDNLWEN